MLCYYCSVLKNLSKLVFLWNFLAGGGGQKSKTSPRAPTEPGYAYFRPPAKLLPLSLKSLSDCLILTPPPHLTLNLPTRGNNLAGVRIGHSPSLP